MGHSISPRVKGKKMMTMPSGYIDLIKKISKCFLLSRKREIKKSHGKCACVNIYIKVT